MSLWVITDKQELISSGIKYVDYNDVFFDGALLKDNKLTRQILECIDKAKYFNQNCFVGRDPQLGALNKSCLSTGCKTLLNIANNPTICFDVCGCGDNALEALSFIHDGIIYWENPVLFLTQDLECDIEYKGEHFSKYTHFLQEVMN